MTGQHRSPILPAIAIAAGVAAATSFLVAAAPAANDGDTTALLMRLEALEQASSRSAPAPHDRELARRLESLEQRIAELESARVAPPATAEVESPAETPTDAARAAVRDELAVGLATDPASREHAHALDRLAAHLVACAGPPRDETELAWATRALLRESYRDRVGPEDAARLEPVLFALPVGHTARKPLAQAIAIGWSSDSRMGAFLSRFPTNAEPSVHQGVLAILDDEHPSEAFSEYVIRIIREEREPAVLGIALGLDRIEAAATAAVAPRLVDVIVARVEGGGLDDEMRARAGLAIAVASLRAVEVGVRALRRIAERETDEQLATLFHSAAAQLASGDATLKSLERLFY